MCTYLLSLWKLPDLIMISVIKKIKIHPFVVVYSPFTVCTWYEKHSEHFHVSLNQKKKTERKEERQEKTHEVRVSKRKNQCQVFFLGGGEKVKGRKKKKLLEVEGA